MDSKQHIYEVNELQEHKEVQNEMLVAPSNSQYTAKSSGKVSSAVQVILQIVALIALGVLLVITATTLLELNDLRTCDNTQSPSPVTSGSSSSSSSSTNINNTWADLVLRQITQLLSKAQGTENNTEMLSQLMMQLNTMKRSMGKLDGFLASSADQAAYSQNSTDILHQLVMTTGDSADRLKTVVGTLANLQDTSTSIAGVVDDILLVVEQLLELQNATILFSSIQPVSCKDIKARHPNSPSGYYHVNSRLIYCNMGELCGSGGGWTRLAYLDMSDATVNCPPGFRLYQSGGVRACGRPASSGGSCVSVNFQTNGINYSQVCGRVTGYQYHTTDAVYSGINDINSYYVDGVSITRGSPRQHIWTLISAHDTISGVYTCPCAIGSFQQIQSFIGSNYFCETGNPTNKYPQAVLYTSDPLWDGQGCNSVEVPCCSAPGIPWFHRNYGNATTTDYLELRVCGNQEPTDEDSPVGYYEIYVK